VDKEKEQNTETDNPNFCVGFIEFLQKDEHKEDNARQSSMAIPLD